MRRFLLPFSTLALLSACVPLDLLGEEEIVKQHDESQAPPPAITDDKIEDKHPVFDEGRTIDETFGPCTVTLNKSAAVTKLDVVPPQEGAPAPTLLPSYSAAAATGDVLPTMEVVNGMLKPFDDGLYAAVELGAEDGSDGSAIDKRAVFRDLLAELIVRSTSGTTAEQPLARDAAAQFAAAVKLGEGSVSAPSDIASKADSLIAAFDGESLASRPIGFYTWSPALSAIFRRDRFLQSWNVVAPSFGAFAATSSALVGKPELGGRYGRVLDLYAGLTNPFFDKSPRDLMSFVPTPSSLDDVAGLRAAFEAKFPETAVVGSCGAHLAFVPASDSAENKLFRTLFCGKGVPEGTNLIDLLVDRIRSGAIDLTPTATSGWYDRQLYALETLLLPEKASEKDHLFLTRRYKEKLVETFKTILIENRETHVKQFGGVSGGTSAEVELVPVDVYPLLPAEPFPTFYLRTARAYRFVETLLTGVMGKDFLVKSRRVLDSGSRATLSLGDELRDRATLLYGLHVLTAASIGMADGLVGDDLVDRTVAAERARTWLRGWKTDPDVSYDPRVIVPVFRDLDRNVVRYWAVIGVKTIDIEASFYPGHEPKFLGMKSSYEYAFRSFVAHHYRGPIAQNIEVELSASKPPPTRAELRAICDREGTLEKIVTALKAR